LSLPRDKYLPSHNRGIPVPKEPTTIGGHLRRRRLQFKMHQSQAAQKLNVSTVTLSRWECDKVYPTWPHQRAVIAYLGYDPFTNPALGRPKGNETSGVAFLSSDLSTDIGQQIKKRRIELKKTRKQMAEELGISIKTLWGLETKRHQPSALLRTQIVEVLGSNLEIARPEE
jgi:transcriptional regulator with XRE-family HTH domain